MKAEDVLKQAIILEERGKSFYTEVASAAKSEGIRTLFRTMAEEEKKHSAYLCEQFKSYSATKFFTPTDTDDKPVTLSAAVLTKSIKAEISGAGFEAAAISAAMALEKNAVALYEGRSREAETENEKVLYAWLADWEKTHLDLLVAIDRELTEKVWYDNSFWPF